MGVSTVNNKVSSPYSPTDQSIRSSTINGNASKAIGAGAGAITLIGTSFYTQQSHQDNSANQSNNQDNKSGFGKLISWWGNPVALLTDASLSALVYCLTYVFINRHFASFEPMQGFIQDIHNRLPEAERAYFTEVRNKLHRYDQDNSQIFWKDFFAKHILEDKENFAKMSRFKQFQAKACKAFFKDHRRTAFGLLVGAISLIRAYAVTPHLNAFLGICIGAFPVISNRLFGNSDKVKLEKGEASPEARKASWISECFNFWGKVGTSLIKKPGSPAEMISAASLITIQRITRDKFEGGIPENPEEDRNPVNRAFSKLPGMQRLRKFGPLESGLLNSFDVKKDTNVKGYLAKEIAMKVTIKYATQLAVLGFIGAALSGLSKVFGSLFGNNNPKQANPSTNRTTIINLIPVASFSNTNGLTNNYAMSN